MNVTIITSNVIAAGIEPDSARILGNLQNGGRQFGLCLKFDWKIAPFLIQILLAG